MAESDRTAVQSHEPSLLEAKGAVEAVAPAANPASVEPIIADEKNAGVVDTKRNSQISADNEEDGFEYPKSWKLAAITTALCLSVFCMALVSDFMSWKSSRY
jgi:hypothetical protein